MKRQYFSLIILYLLTGCTAPIQKMTALDAVKFGNNQYFEMPNYRLDMQSQFINFEISASDGERPLPPKVNQYINHFGKNLQFGTTLVIDSPSQQYQMIPYYGYQSKNLNANIRFPVVFNRKEMSVYADFSAVDGLFTNLDNAGKYSRFDLSKLPIPAETDLKILKLVRKYTDLTLSDVPASAFIDSAITDEDRRAHVVRSIQYSIKPQDALTHVPTLLQDLADIVSPDKKIEIPSLGMDELKAEMDKMMGPDSSDTYTVGFNRAGQIVTLKALSDYQLNIPDDNADADAENLAISPASKGSAKMKFLTTFTLHDIGRAKIIDAPTEANTVDGLENFKGSPLGGFANALGTNDEAQAEPAAGAALDAAAIEAGQAPAVHSKAKRKTKKRKH